MITVDFDRLKVRPGLRVLDVGCGTGRHTCAASRHDGVVSVGMDIRFNDVKEAGERLQYEKSLGVQAGSGALLVADITSLPFKDETFDLVICSEVLEHIPEEDRAIGELARVVKHGMDLVVSVPRYLPERICWALSDDYYKANDGHIRIYRKKELARRLEGAGARVWATHFAHGLHAPYWWLKCLVGPTREDSISVNLYHRFLVWDMMKRPWISRLLDYLLNPLMGKSIVLYTRKEKHARRDRIAEDPTTSD